MPFFSLGLEPALAQAAANLGFAAPTPIQTEAIPPVLAGRDLLASARTGSGKTAAYALPLLQRWLDRADTGPRRTRALVLVPTRELAAQVGEVLRSLAQALPRRPKLVVAFGGVSINPQLMALRGGADVVVATPGRLLDLVDHNGLRLDSVDLLVLDEADRLLDLGFADELARVRGLLPTQRQNLLFSATVPPAVETMALQLLHDPVRVDVPTPDDDADAPLVQQRAFAVDEKRRTQLLRQLMKTEGWKPVLVFVATQYAAERLANKLHHGEVYATAFHGGLSQGARQTTLGEFKAGRWDVLVTTDLAARGIHIDGLPVVVNFDLPRSAVDHLHRIGRTARAGQAGLAVSFVTAAQLAHWHLIEKRQGLSLPLETVEGFEPTETPPPPAPGNGGVKGKRPSKKDKLRAQAAKP
ncbi:DEAD/DEAH box helicase [Hydrogenophaga sp. H7]|uniref:DEAD/DEAH box helicase n=1 Tax=Hydrogenophaga sp. H7 TaxID=1882399 RepID=UPI0009A374A0|nr:DEAD/DEAH box helicase [Hydrogenophaga sp. H7]OPF63412.1 RNA helicase [Hydrogenophaga sp. H7]